MKEIRSIETSLANLITVGLFFIAIGCRSTPSSSNPPKWTSAAQESLPKTVFHETVVSCLINRRLLVIDRHVRSHTPKIAKGFSLVKLTKIVQQVTGRELTFCIICLGNRARRALKKSR